MVYYEDNVINKLADVFGIGATKSISIKVNNTSIQDVGKLVDKLAVNDGWKKQHENNLSTSLYQEWLAGSFSVSGYQMIKIKLMQIDQDVKIDASSSSRGGQIQDWGANQYNLMRLEKIFSEPDFVLGKRVVPGETKGIVFLTIALILGVTFAIIIVSIFHAY